eukprot:CCRYP_020876-RA/>CCRYP_020876-RA protein AED:0.18 eAED:0.18 QI:179/1/0.75/1/0/0/4/135/39
MLPPMFGRHVNFMYLFNLGQLGAEILAPVSFCGHVLGRP